MWHPAGKASDLAKGTGRVVEIAGQKIALFHVGGKFHAMANSCMHRGGPLGDGHLENTQVTCPWHAWEFDVTTGKCLTMEGATQKTFAVKVENGEIRIEV